MRGTHSCCLLVLYIYDSVITVDREVALFWSSKPNIASLLYFANKYLSLIRFSVDIAYNNVFVLSDAVCYCPNPGMSFV